MASRRPRVVAPDKRQRAAYSCDRCKSKKTKCIRIVPPGGHQLDDKTHPCRNCLKAGVECLTSQPRRRRVYGSFENLGIHYQTVISLVQGLYPDIDINDVGELMSLGRQLGINMDDVVDESKLLEAEAKVLKPFTPQVSGVAREASRKSSASAEGQHSAAAAAAAEHVERLKVESNVRETVVYDSTGGSHYVGSSGTPSLFTLLCNLLLKRSLIPTLSFDNKITLFQNAAVRSQDYRAVSVSLLSHKTFPVIQLISSREIAEKLVNTFFDKVHPFYFIFQREAFSRLHSLFWQKLTVDEPAMDHTALDNPMCGCIFLVWSIASKMCDVVLERSDEIDEVLHLILPDATLGASTSSIQFLYLYATYLHSKKNRDASWNLIGLAIRQAMSLGLHRDMANDNTNAQIFWTLYQTELSLCSNFGRQSTINEEEITIGYPDLTNELSVSDGFKQYYLSTLKLSRFLSKIIKERRVATAQQPLSLINIERTLALKTQLNNLYYEINIKPMSQIVTVYDFKLSILYHHYMTLLTLPFLVFITTNNYKILSDETLLSIVQMGLQSAVIIAQTMDTTLHMSLDLHNGGISQDCMVGYISSLCLSLFCIYLCNGSNDTWEIPLDIQGTHVTLDKEATLVYISMISQFMQSYKLDSTTTRIAEVTQGLTKDLNAVLESQLSDMGFDLFTLQPAEQLVFDSLFSNNDIYLSDI